MLKEEIKKMLDARKAPFKMELKGSDLIPSAIEQIIEMFLYVEGWLTCTSVYAETYKCGCCYDHIYGPNRETLETMANRLLEEKEAIEKIEFTIYYDDEFDSIGAPTIEVFRKDICEECLREIQEVVELKEIMHPDSLLQQAIYSHGLATGFGVNEVSAEKAEENLKTLLDLVGSDKEICCSWKTQQIGGFGLFVRGEVTIASNKDLWSYVGRSGSREFNVDESYEYLIDRKKDLDLTVWDHTEFFVKLKELIAFWAKDWFVRDVPGGRELVEKLQDWGYKVYITKPRHR